jgi:sporulation protein YlmC with PRC-barrel domain
MADYDRYGDTRTEDRSYGSRYRGDDDRTGRGGSIFNFGGNDRDNDWRGRNRDDDYGDRNRSRSSYGRGGGMDRDGGRDRFYGPDDTRDGLARDETSHLIASNKVEGTAVYGRNGERLGSIYNFMVDKRSGQVEYAVMSYGGFLGLGSRYYPIPWRMLTYNTREGGYHVDMTERDLENAPSFNRDNEPRYDRRYSGRVHDYYGINY